MCAPDGRTTVKSPPGGALAWTAVAGAIAGFVGCLVGWLAGGGSVDLAWAPTLDLRLEFALDGLGALYALLATGIGAVVFAYGAAYLPLHLEHTSAGRPTEGRRFWPWMTLFMMSMVGLACARDLVLLFVFFDFTAVASYFLIGFDRDQREARQRGADGVAGHGRERRGLTARGRAAVRRLRDVLAARALRARPRRTTTRSRRADRRRRTGQERAGAAALLATARDGGANARVGLSALRRDGGRRRARARPCAPVARA